MRDWLTFAAVWLFQRIRSCALALLVALITTCITTTARASVGPTVTSKPPGLSDTATAFRHDAENPLRVPHDRANARRLGAPGARSEASTHGPCSADTAPRGRHLGRLTSRCYRYMDGPERCYTATYDAANNPTTLTDPEMRRELSYDSL
ncbi:MAG TPA: hypothetical protein VHP33_06880, partial [Polyangiaceae bacterium]|nr:hypothetical protein [Polyangiaceae bacterium]